MWNAADKCSWIGVSLLSELMDLSLHTSENLFLFNGVVKGRALHLRYVPKRASLILHLTFNTACSWKIWSIVELYIFPKRYLAYAFRQSGHSKIYFVVETKFPETTPASIMVWGSLAVPRAHTRLPLGCLPRRPYQYTCMDEFIQNKDNVLNSAIAENTEL